MKNIWKHQVDCKVKEVDGCHWVARPQPLPPLEAQRPEVLHDSVDREDATRLNRSDTHRIVMNFREFPTNYPNISKKIDQNVEYVHFLIIPVLLYSVMSLGSGWIHLGVRTIPLFQRAKMVLRSEVRDL